MAIIAANEKEMLRANFHEFIKAFENTFEKPIKYSDNTIVCRAIEEATNFIEQFLE